MSDYGFRHLPIKLENAPSDYVHDYLTSTL